MRYRSADPISLIAKELGPLAAIEYANGSALASRLLLAQ